MASSAQESMVETMVSLTKDEAGVSMLGPVHIGMILRKSGLRMPLECIITHCHPLFLARRLQLSSRIEVQYRIGHHGVHRSNEFILATRWLPRARR